MIRMLPRALVALALISTTLSAQRGVAVPQQLAFTPYDASGIYDVGETVGWTVTPGPTPPTYALQVDDSAQQRRGPEGGHAGSVQPARHNRDGRRPSRSMIYVAVEAVADRAGAAPPRPPRPPRFIGGNTGRNTGFYAVGAAVAPTKIGLSTPRPADFDTFWNGKLAAQATVPINPVLTPVDDRRRRASS